MHPVRTAVCSILVFSMLAASLRADVIGSAPAAPKPEAGAVARQMESLGLAAAEARRAAEALPAEEAAWFASRPERVQIVGKQEVQTLWYESVLGGAFLVAVAAFAAGVIIHNRDS
jgi:hypothetical protein